MYYGCFGELNAVLCSLSFLWENVRRVLYFSIFSQVYEAKLIHSLPQIPFDVLLLRLFVNQEIPVGH